MSNGLLVENKNSSHKLMSKTTFIEYKTQISHMRIFIEDDDFSMDSNKK
jgi:hypothetical protein